MKLRYLGSVMSALALAVVAPACGDDGGDDSPATTDDADSGSDDNTDDEATEDDATEEDATDDATEEDATDDATEEDATDDATEEDATDDATEGDAGTDDATTEEDAGSDDATTEEDAGTDDSTEETSEGDSGTDVEPEGGGPIDTCVPPEPEEVPEPADCPPVEDREIVEVSGEIEGEVWTCDNSYLLTGYTYVVGDNTLTIEPGVVVYGTAESALVITRGSQIDAVGQVDAPIVFTSASLEGERAPGDWGGVHLLGAAPINTGEDVVEGVDPDENRGVYGGDDWEHNCGTLKYVRVEFAGFEFAPDEELNGIGVAGCGSQTTLSYVQVHKGSDDGIEFWGGAAQASHIVISGAQDDSLDWDAGFQGKVQFLAVQQNPAEGDAAFESDNNEDDNSLTPRSQPTIYNATLVGAPGNTGLVLRRGTWGIVRNSIITGFDVATVDVRDAESVLGTEADPLGLTIESSILNGPFETEEGDADDDEGFDEEAFFSAAARNNQIDADPELGDVESLTAPDFVPASGSPAAEGAAATPAGDAFFDCSASYLGAFEPGGDDWTAEWTSYPTE